MCACVVSAWMFRRLWFVTVAVVLALSHAVSAAAPAAFHYVLDMGKSRLDPKSGSTPINWDGKKVGQEDWFAGGGVFSYNRHVDHTDTSVSDFRSTWTYGSLPPARLLPGDRIVIGATGTAGADRNSPDKQDATFAKVSADGLDMTKFEEGFVGWAGDAARTFRESSVASYDYLVPDQPQDQIEIRIHAGHFYRTTGALYLVYVYKRVDGPPGPDEPSVPPPPPPIVKPPGKPALDAPRSPREPPQISISLKTMRYSSGEQLYGTVDVKTGLAEGEEGEGRVRWNIYPDTGAETLGLFTKAGGRTVQKSAIPAAVLSGDSVVKGSALCTLDAFLIFGMIAPAKEGEYLLVADLTMDDGQQATATAALDVMDNPRRLMVGAIIAGAAMVGQSLSVSLPMVVTGHDAAGAPPAIAKASGDAIGLTGQAKGVRVFLADQNPDLKPSGKVLAGFASWQVVFPKPGVYKITCKVTVPRYGEQEQGANVVVQGGGPAANSGSMTIDTGGGRVDANTQPSPASSDTSGDLPAADPLDITQSAPSESAIPAVGMDIASRDGQFVVSSMDSGGSAYHAGIRSGDRLITIDQKKVDGMPPSAILKFFKSKRSQDILLLVLRSADGKDKKVALLLPDP